MNRTKDKLLLECIKQFEHIENVLGYNRLSTTRSLINEINKALTIPAVVGRSEQLVCTHCDGTGGRVIYDTYLKCKNCNGSGAN